VHHHDVGDRPYCLEVRRMLKALVRKKKLPQSEVIEALIREEYGKR